MQGFIWICFFETLHKRLVPLSLAVASGFHALATTTLGASWGRISTRYVQEVYMEILSGHSLESILQQELQGDTCLQNPSFEFPGLGCRLPA